MAGCGALVAVAVLLVGRALAAEAGSQGFYAGKTVRIVVGYASGGGYDFYARAVARHMGKYVPGNPAFVVENMPGAGSLAGICPTFRWR